MVVRTTSESIRSMLTGRIRSRDARSWVAATSMRCWSCRAMTCGGVVVRPRAVSSAMMSSIGPSSWSKIRLTFQPSGDRTRERPGRLIAGGDGLVADVHVLLGLEQTGDRAPVRTPGCSRRRTQGRRTAPAGRPSPGTGVPPTIREWWHHALPAPAHRIDARLICSSSRMFMTSPMSGRRAAVSRWVTLTRETRIFLASWSAVRPAASLAWRSSRASRNARARADWCPSKPPVAGVRVTES